MKHIINDQVVLSRPLEGPLAAQIAAFARCAREQGYARQSTVPASAARGGFQSMAGTAGRPTAGASHPSIRHGICDLALDGCGSARGDAAALRQFLGFLRRRRRDPRGEGRTTPTDAG